MSGIPIVPCEIEAQLVYKVRHVHIEESAVLERCMIRG